MNFTRYWLSLMLFWLVTSACSPRWGVQSLAQDRSDQSGLTYLALGDSYTVGEGIEKEQSFPYQLTRTFIEEGYSLTPPVVMARTGWTTDELIGALEESLPQEKFDLVTLLIGVNNQFRGYSTEIYRSEFRYLLQRSLRYASDQTACVVVLSIPDWGVTPFARMTGFERGQVSLKIDRFNRINREETELAGVTYIDVTEISRRAAEEPSLIAGDGLHPSESMYRLWVEKILPQARTCLSEK